MFQEQHVFMHYCKLACLLINFRAFDLEVFFKN